ncbi:hypothetical protein L2E82_48591 [Cichorium intybus]|uniref:Uncharacterized protein n=1 Tax=Cichorium intybus TaxID=13427 RepID=A0ACB8YZ04_CICIN|nr:hypothetical protein L2E82_48591 [Cichorium intybus]
MKKSKLCSLKSLEGATNSVPGFLFAIQDDERSQALATEFRLSGQASLGLLELNSTHTTPTKSLTKPPNPRLIYGGNRPPVRTYCSSPSPPPSLQLAFTPVALPATNKIQTSKVRSKSTELFGEP